MDYETRIIKRKRKKIAVGGDDCVLAIRKVSLAPDIVTTVANVLNEWEKTNQQPSQRV